MREIKFRAWDKKLKKFVYFKLNNFGIELRKDMDTILSADEDRDDLQQFTGSLDLNGVEIYEGDIVIGKPTGFNNKYEFFKDVVIWYNSGWYVGHNNDKGLCVISLTSFVNLEIVGNIYEGENYEKKN